MRRIVGPLGAVLVVGLAGCAIGGALPGPAAREATMPPCSEAPGLIFEGDTTMAALGLGEMMGPGEANRVGHVWVTEPFVPRDMGPGGPVQPERWLCMEFDDGSGMGTTVPIDWQPPGSTLELEGGGSPLPVIGALMLVGTCIIITVLAFRHD